MIDSEERVRLRAVNGRHHARPDEPEGEYYCHTCEHTIAGSMIPHLEHRVSFRSAWASVHYWDHEGRPHTRGPYRWSKAERVQRELRSYGYTPVEVG